MHLCKLFCVSPTIQDLSTQQWPSQAEPLHIWNCWSIFFFCFPQHLIAWDPDLPVYTRIVNFFTFNLTFSRKTDESCCIVHFFIFNTSCEKVSKSKKKNHSRVWTTEVAVQQLYWDVRACRSHNSHTIYWSVTVNITVPIRHNSLSWTANDCFRTPPSLPPQPHTPRIPEHTGIALVPKAGINEFNK